MAQVRDMVMHFREIWGPEKGNSRYIFVMTSSRWAAHVPWGNRVAGVRKTKGCTDVSQGNPKFISQVIHPPQSTESSAAMNITDSGPTHIH